LAGHFPRRNRILTGLSLGVLVVEAALKSGSLISARLANEQGREVFAIPGSIHNPQARGCHALIKQGAKLVETAQDILEELPPLLGLLAESAIPEAAETPTSANQPLLDAMGYDPISIDELAQLTQLPASEISAKMLLLELEGHVSSSLGGLYCRTH
jgi:DNA processing protein